ncbi:Hsp20/alpha crystallin family protein [Dactylococcopsis salina]|uniref:hypothetical protein n=1 Tax=Dactylococcopsis salina TaxID=292566 RepID=UPI0002F2B909|nr:hypothetical protein [Dactylococcopsis salina]
MGIKQDQVEADYSDGILSLRLPKVEDAVNRSVKINLGGQSNTILENWRYSIDDLSPPNLGGWGALR